MINIWLAIAFLISNRYSDKRNNYALWGSHFEKKGNHLDYIIHYINTVWM